MTRAVALFVIGLAASALAQGIALAHLVTALRNAPWGTHADVGSQAAAARQNPLIMKATPLIEAEFARRSLTLRPRDYIARHSPWQLSSRVAASGR